MLADCGWAVGNMRWQDFGKSQTQCAKGIMP